MNKTISLPKCLTGFHLKVIAIVSMLIDHIAYITLPYMLGTSYNAKNGSVVYDGFKQSLLIWMADHETLLWTINDVFHWIGRLAFPIFCFLLVEGFLHTKNRGKYAFRLALFALISEIPYDMAFNNCFLTLKNNNVFFTLLVGLLMIWGISKTKEWLNKLDEDKMKARWKKLIYIGAVVVFAVAAMFLVSFVFDSSYSESGVLTILILYLLRERKSLAVTISVVMLALLNFSVIELFALPVAILVAMYNNERGPSMKYFFYVFYPAHLLILTFLGVWLGNMEIIMEFMK